jgi:hypothetical protein
MFYTILSLNKRNLKYTTIIHLPFESITLEVLVFFDPSMTEETQFEPGTYKEPMHVNWDQLLTRNNRAVNLKIQQITTTTTATNATLVTTGSHNLSTSNTQKCIN